MEEDDTFDALKYGTCLHCGQAKTPESRATHILCSLRAKQSTPRGQRVVPPDFDENGSKRQGMSPVDILKLLRKRNGE